MHHISDWLTHIDNEADKPYLRSKLLDVNIRLMKANTYYAEVIAACCHHLQRHVLTKLDGYKLPHGTSGANLAIPFNVIAIARNRGRDDAWAEVMINPLICKRSGTAIKVQSNCGSIRLKEPIEITRSPTILLQWFDLDGEKHMETFTREQGSLTIQHEVDHNLGILITDYLK